MGYLYIASLRIYHELFPSSWRKESILLVIQFRYLILSESAIVFRWGESAWLAGSVLGECQPVRVTSGSSVYLGPSPSKFICGDWSISTLVIPRRSLRSNLWTSTLFDALRRSSTLLQLLQLLLNLPLSQVENPYTNPLNCITGKTPLLNEFDICLLFMTQIGRLSVSIPCEHFLHQMVRLPREEERALNHLE